VGTVDLILRMIESGVIFRDLRMENPIRSIREISHDLTGRQVVRMANGREMTALAIQQEFLAKVTDFVAANGAHNAHVPRILDLWGRTLAAIESRDYSGIDTEIDWAIKKKLVDGYRSRHGLELDSARVAQLDLTYHDISPTRGLFNVLRSRGAVARVVDDISVKAAVDLPPQTTRAKLRGDFVRRAQDPFLSVDDRVDALIASIGD
jgi:proteasome accessory factor A